MGVAGAGLVAACSRAGEPPKAGGSPGDGPKIDVPPLPAGATMPTRALGRTGATVSLLGIGGFHLGKPKSDAEAIAIVHEAIDHGVTFLDNCWDYNGGLSEERMGKSLASGKRKQVFLMTKLDGRTAESATEQLEQSLKRLGTDVIDLVQVHEVIRRTDPVRVFGKGGAIEALVRAKEQGKIRFIGFTGHKSPSIHKEMLETAASHGFRFDTVQMPLNVMDPHYDSFEKNVLPLLTEQSIGVLGMKSMGDGIILKSGVVSPLECLHYSMSLPTSVVITGCDSQAVLRQALYAAYTHKPMEPAQVEALLARTRPVAEKGEFEKFKTSTQFDGTAANPRWLESAKI